MSQAYTYSEAAFTSGIAVDKLHYTVDNDGIITTECEGVTYRNAEVVFTFVSALSAPEQTQLDAIVSVHDGQPIQYTKEDIEWYLNTDAEVTDPVSELVGPWWIMQILMHRRDLYNDSDSPIYDEDHVPVLGDGGWAEDHADRIGNLENIHVKLGWHQQQVIQQGWTRPKDMMIYYGWPSGFNAYWNNELVAQDLARYGLIVLGAGLEVPTHGDYSNTCSIVARVKQLNPSCLIFGYIDTTASESTFTTKTGQWDTVGVHGIFMDKYGYDFSNTRAQQNTRVDIVHDAGLVAFANCWNMNHAIGTANDLSYPNSTYNNPLTESKLTINDWYLMESFILNTDAYTSTGGYEAKAQWAARVATMLPLRAAYGINVAGGGILLDTQTGGQGMFDFFFTGAMMASLDAAGVSDTYYGASSGKGKFWTRPDVSKMGRVYTLNPSIQVDAGDSDVYHRYSELAKMSLDFSGSAEASSITKW